MERCKQLCDALNLGLSIGVVTQTKRPPTIKYKEIQKVILGNRIKAGATILFATAFIFLSIETKASDAPSLALQDINSPLSANVSGPADGHECGLFPPITNFSGITEETFPKFSWQKDPNCSWYQIWVIETDSGETVYQNWYTAEQTKCSDIDDIECEIRPAIELSYGEGFTPTEYTWQLRGWSSEAGAGPWSDPREGPFTVFLGGCNFGSQALFFDGFFNTSDTYPYLSWSGIAQECPWWQIQLVEGTAEDLEFLYDDDDAIWIANETLQCEGFASSLTCGVRWRNALTPGTQYVWRVRSWSEVTGTGEWSNPVEFRVEFATCAAAPFAIQEPRTDMASVPDFKWYSPAFFPVSSCSWYQIRIRNIADSETVYEKWVTAEQSGCANREDGDCEISTGVDLAYGEYVWDVRAWSIGTKSGARSEPVNFSIALDGCKFPPTVEPLDPNFDSLPEFQWQSPVVCPWHQIEVRNTSSGEIAYSQWITSDQSNCATELPYSCGFRTLSELDYGFYEVRVRSYSPKTFEGEWSQPESFSVNPDGCNGPPELIAPTGLTVDTQPTFEWVSPVSCPWFEIWVRSDGGETTYRGWITETQAACVEDDFVRCQFTLPFALNPERYEWEVRAWSPGTLEGEWNPPGQEFEVITELIR